MSGRLWWAAAALIVVAAFGLRISYVALTPDFEIVHDARAYHYDWHARSVANGEGFSKGLTGKPTAFRPPGYVYALAGAYRLFGVPERPPDAERIRVARWLGVILGTLGVALTGAVAARPCGARRAGLAALSLAAVYLPVDPRQRRDHVRAALRRRHARGAAQRSCGIHRTATGSAAFAGLLAGLAVLTRANGADRACATRVRGVGGSAGPPPGPPAVLVAVALLTVAPWTIRNERRAARLRPGHDPARLGARWAPTTTRPATGPGQPRIMARGPARFEQYRPINRLLPRRRLRRRWSGSCAAPGSTTSAPTPGYVADVAYWNTRRLLDLASPASGRATRPRRSASPPGWADAGVICFWIFAALAGRR